MCVCVYITLDQCLYTVKNILTVTQRCILSTTRNT